MLLVPSNVCELLTVALHRCCGNLLHIFCRNSWFNFLQWVSISPVQEINHVSLFTYRNPVIRDSSAPRVLDEPLESLPQRRAQAILLYNDGLSATEIAHTLERHVNTIYAYLTAFDQHGLPGVYQEGKRGAPARLSPANAGRSVGSPTSRPKKWAYRMAVGRCRSYALSEAPRDCLYYQPGAPVAHLKKGACVSAAYSES